MADEAKSGSASEIERDDLVRISGLLIAAVERGLNATGTNFAALFRAVRLQMADDYPFLDPVVLDASAERFEYAGGEPTLSGGIAISAYITGLSEALRRVVNQVAIGANARRVRERVGLELALLARKNGALARSGFGVQLDRIAGTKVI